MKWEIKPVTTRDEWIDFLELPRYIYSKNELAKLPPPKILDYKFTRHSNPFLSHIEWAGFTARSERAVLGRIIASIDYNCPHESWGFFGLFECIDDENIAQKLIQTATDWLLRHNKTKLYGPVCLSTSDNIGCLVEGFDEPNPFYLPYNPPYYNDLLLNSGLEASFDLYSYNWHNSQSLSERIIRIGKRLQKSSKVSIRPIRYRQLKQEAYYFRDIYNQAMVDDWGHIPLTADEALYILANHRRVIPPEYFLWAQVDNMPVGVCLALPNFPDRTFRLVLLAVKPEYNHLGLSALLIAKMIQISQRDKLTSGELSFVQEGNAIVNKLILQDVGSAVAKRYRLYSKDLF